ncbi:MAG: hypothetical protein GKR87_05975 [Kiritimatiellae bacterium]|nr:hypothetical protein [Kiritimatiellia bacterium]
MEFAKELLPKGGSLNPRFLKENAYRFSNAKRNNERFGGFTTVYSAGLFDYINTSQLTKIVGGLWESLVDRGMLILPFKDKLRYETFDYHWLVKWDAFFQRDQNEFVDICRRAGIPEDSISTERDDVW